MLAHQMCDRRSSTAGVRRFPLVVAVALVALGLIEAASGNETPKVARTHELAALRVVHEALSRPDSRASVLELVQPRRPLTGERTVLPVLGRATGAKGVRWLHVRLPGRPNGHTGWIRQRGAVTATTGWAVFVGLSHRRVSVYRHGRRVRMFSAVVGKPSTPTPRGRFFVEESFRILPGAAGGPYAIALSARSNVYQEFHGGPGQVAVHGIDGIGGRPGTAVSHGCIRLNSSDMAWLGSRIGPGVPVTITR
jgi:lipoprotein-anchoring transpeptidase ErfK/SrfK